MTMSPSAGIGLKPEHYADALATRADGLWFEVHPENYMVAGGPRLAWMEAIRDRHPLSLHGVALSLAADAAPVESHLARLTDLVRRFEPALDIDVGAPHAALRAHPRAGRHAERRLKPVAGQQVAHANARVNVVIAERGAHQLLLQH